MKMRIQKVCLLVLLFCPIVVTAQDLKPFTDPDDRPTESEPVLPLDLCDAELDSCLAAAEVDFLSCVFGTFEGISADPKEQYGLRGKCYDLYESAIGLCQSAHLGCTKLPIREYKRVECLPRYRKCFHDADEKYCECMASRTSTEAHCAAERRLEFQRCDALGAWCWRPSLATPVP